MNVEEVKKQAEYCLNCKTKPCMSGCPLQNNIPDFIKGIKEEKYEEAAQAFELAVSIYPRYYDALYNLRDTYLELGNKQGAKECTECMKNIKPTGTLYG